MGSLLMKIHNGSSNPISSIYPKKMKSVSQRDT